MPPTKPNYSSSRRKGYKPYTSSTVSARRQHVISKYRNASFYQRPKIRDTSQKLVISGFFMCECCPSNPKKFTTAEELHAHETGKRTSSPLSSEYESIDETETSPVEPVNQQTWIGEDAMLYSSRSKGSKFRPLSLHMNCDFEPITRTNFSVHPTISKDYTAGEKARQADLFAALAKRLHSYPSQNRGRMSASGKPVVRPMKQNTSLFYADLNSYYGSKW